jgi:hypothetical protein
LTEPQSNAGQRAPKGPGLAKSVLFTLAIWTVFLGLAEIGLRLHEAGLGRDPGTVLNELRMCEPHPARLWHYKRDFQQAHETPEFRVDLRTNSWRLRSPEPELGASLRILVIGDSFTFGWGVEERERYSEVLGRILAEADPSRSVAVLNAGHWSYSFDQQLVLLRELLPRFRPQIVVQGLYAANVLIIESHDWERTGDGLIERVRKPGIRVDDLGRVRFTNDWLERPPLPSRLMTWVSRLWLNYRLSRWAMTRDLALFDTASDVHERGWGMTREALAQTGEALRRAGARWIAVGIPRDVEVSSRERSEAARRLIERPGIDLALPMRRLSELVASAGGDWVDPLPAFQGVDSSRLYFEVDPHWRPAAHEIVGRLAADRIRARP